MAGSIINQNGSSSITVTNLIEILEGQRINYDATSLTNYTSSELPAIASGSVINIGGSLYRFSTEESISTSNVTSTASATYYIELVPSSSECTAQFSTTPPEWRNDYCAWYTSTVSSNRQIGELEWNDVNGGYYYKNEYKFLDRYREKKIYIPNSFSTATVTVNTDHFISNPFSTILYGMGRVTHAEVSIEDTVVTHRIIPMEHGDADSEQIYELFVLSTFVSVTRTSVGSSQQYFLVTVRYI